MATLPAGARKPSANPRPKEQRAWMRYPCNLKIHCRLVAVTPGKSWPAWAMDISAGGLRILFNYPLQPGAFLIMDLSNVFQGFSHTALVRVVRTASQPYSERWILGCAFVHALDEKILRSLLL